jgi:hypothetical protein
MNNARSAVSVSKSGSGNILHFSYDPDIVAILASSDPDFASSTLFLATTSKSWNVTASQTLYVRYCTITARCTSALSPKIDPTAMVEVQTPVISTTKFTRNLGYGMKGLDVRALQQFLNQHGYIVAKNGIGSPGKESDYFGFGTMVALKKFQLDHAITLYGRPVSSSSVGGFGNITRRYVNGLI